MFQPGREAGMLYDPETANVTIDLANAPYAAQAVPSIAADRFVWTVLAALVFAAVVGLILLIRHRRALARAAGNTALDGIAAAVKAKRSLQAEIEKRIKD
jgi:hypothetical protein